MTNLDELIIYVEKQRRAGLIPKKVRVRRGGKTFEQTRWVRPEEKPKDLKQTRSDAEEDYLKKFPGEKGDVSYAFLMLNEANKIGHLWCHKANYEKFQTLVYDHYGSEKFRGSVERREGLPDWMIMTEEQEFREREKKAILFEKERAKKVLSGKYGKNVVLYRAIYGDQAKAIKKALKGKASVKIEVNPLLSYTTSEKFAEKFGATMEFTIEEYIREAGEKVTFHDPRRKTGEICIIKETTSVDNIWMSSESNVGMSEAYERFAKSEWKDADEFLATHKSDEMAVPKENIQFVKVKNVG